MAELKAYSSAVQQWRKPFLASGPPPNPRLQRTRRPSLRSGRSLRSLGSPLKRQPLGVGSRFQPGWRRDAFVVRESIRQVDQRLAENRHS